MARKKVLSAERLYINEVRKMPIFSKEKVYELGIRNKNGDLEAQKELFMGHLRFVVSIARKYMKRVNHLSFMDLVQAGNIGLLRSIKTYDPDKGTLTTYAAPEITHYIKYEIATNEKTAPLPIFVQNAKKKYNHFSLEEKAKSDDELIEMLSSYKISKVNLEYVKSDKEIKFVNINDVDEDYLDYCSSYNPDYDTCIASSICDYELFIFLKESLKPMRYFVLYYYILTDSGFNFSKTGELFDISEQAVQNFKARLSKKLRKIIGKKDEVLKEIRKREGNLYYKLRTEPINPNDIIKYLYLKDYFDETERSILYELLLGKYNLNEEEYALYFHMSLREYLTKVKSIGEKVDIIMQDEKRFNDFTNYMRTTYKTGLYNIDLNAKYGDNLEEAITLQKV